MLGIKKGRTIDILLVLCAAITVWRFAQANQTAWLSESSPPRLLQPQTPLQVNGLDWAIAARHVVLMVSPKCEACKESAKFYRELSRRIETQQDSRLAVIGPEPVSELRAWLDANDIRADTVVQAERPENLGFSVTPTLLFVDRSGTVTDVLSLRLSADEEEDVLRVLSGSLPSGSLSNVFEEITEADLGGFPSGSPFVVVDIRGREEFAQGHRTGALNIPQEELALRGRAELPDTASVVVDCRTSSRASCRSAAWMLKSLRVAHVKVLAP